MGRCVELPETLWKRLVEAASSMGEEPERLAVKLLRAALEELVEEMGEAEVSEEERRVIIERLRSLGYL